MALNSPPSRAAAMRRYAQDGAGITSNERLVVMLYERLCTDIAGAAEAIRAGRPNEAHRPLINAQEIVEALDVALDIDRWPGGVGLRAIYDYVGAQLVDANLSKNAQLLDECLRHVAPLRDSWSEAWASLAGAGAAEVSPAARHGSSS